MPTIVQQGAINTTALVVPDLYIQIVPPQNLVLNGVPTNVVGIVGTAPWGPIGVPSIVANMSNYASRFGAVQNRKYDMGTAIALAVLQGAQNFRCVRVTDGTDVAASVTAQSTCITFTGKYTGSLGNTIQVLISAGSKAGSFRAVVTAPGRTGEVFDNITGTGNTFWVNVAAAINNGNSILRGPSHLVNATAGVGTAAPTSPASYTLVGGTDGVASITAASLVGLDVIPRTGMYALRGQGCSVAMLADADDSTQWTTQAAFGLSEGIYMIAVAPAGAAITNGTTGTVDLKTAAGLDSYAVKLLHGDWIYWNDPVNAVLRLVSPQGFVAGLLGNLSPQNSSLNKQVYGVVGSQKSGIPGTGQNTVYSAADLQVLIQNGIDVVSNPQPGGAYWGVRAGRNSSSNGAINGDNYTRMTNYIASTIAAGMGIYDGMTITSTLFQQVRSTLLNFFSNLLQQGLLGSTDGSLPYSVICDITNNPQTRTSLGYLQADVQVVYMAIADFVVVNVEGGQTVTINTQTLPQSSTPATPVF